MIHGGIDAPVRLVRWMGTGTGLTGIICSMVMPAAFRRVGQTLDTKTVMEDETASPPRRGGQ